MSELFARIFVFIGASFCLGLAVGFVLWRAGRHNLSRREWATMRKELARREHAFAVVVERIGEVDRPPRRDGAEAGIEVGEPRIDQFEGQAADAEPLGDPLV